MSIELVKHPSAFNKLYADLQDGSSFLRSNRTTMMVHFALWSGLDDIWKKGTTTTILRDCIEIYRKYGFSVEMRNDKVNWEVS